MTDDRTYTSPAEIRHRIGPSGTFSLNNIAGDVAIRGTQSDEVVAIARAGSGGDELPLVVRRGDDSLHIETDEKSGWLGFRQRGSVDFDISVPVGARIEINGVSSDVNVRGLFGEQNIRSVSGDLSVEAGGGRVGLTTVSGDALVTADGPVELNATTTSGDIQASSPRFEALRLRTVSGDMILNGSFAAGTQHVAESVSGDLSVEASGGLTVDTKKGLDFTKKESRPVVVGDGTANLKFRTLSGDLHVSDTGSGMSAAPPATTPSAPQAPRVDVESTEESMDILRALERGEIDVEEASRRLEGAGHRG